MENDRDYYLRREAAERKAAQDSHDVKARAVHDQLADYYRARAATGEATGAPITVIQVA